MGHTDCLPEAASVVSRPALPVTFLRLFRTAKIIRRSTQGTQFRSFRMRMPPWRTCLGIGLTLSTGDFRAWPAWAVATLVAFASLLHRDVDAVDA